MNEYTERINPAKRPTGDVSCELLLDEDDDSFDIDHLLACQFECND